LQLPNHYAAQVLIFHARARTHTHTHTTQEPLSSLCQQASYANGGLGGLVHSIQVSLFSAVVHLTEQPRLYLSSLACHQSHTSQLNVI